MGANVFANGMEVSCEKSDNQSIAAMPDVCLSPPTPPAGPIPIPYPNFSKASDTTDGTKTVQIAGGMVGMKNKSCYKQSNGNEAATKSQGMGVVTACIQGKTYFAAWSSDVKFEGENAVRFGDMTTHNHASNPMNSGATTGNMGKPAPPATEDDCKELAKENEKAREDLGEKTEDKSLVGVDGEGEGTTVSSAKFKATGGGSSSSSAFSNGKAMEKLPKRFAPGGKMEDRRAGKSNLCPDAKHSHPSPACQKSGHAEARVMDTQGGGTPGRLVFNIDWRPKSGGNSKMPCPDCHKMMCAAKACGIDISICDSKNQPQDVPCPADASSYGSLKETMGEVVVD